MNVSKIVVGIDGSPRQAQVLAAAEELGVRFDAQLILVHSIGIPPEIPQEAWQGPGMDLQSFLERNAREQLEAARDGLPDALRPGALLETVIASPWQGLCTTADRFRADLIVIGSHGYGGLDRVLGTTAARVVNHAACSVLVVRAARNTNLETQ